MNDLSIEKQYSNYVIAGVDEVGRGAIAGPVVAGAVIIKQTDLFNEIIDSKKLSKQKRSIINNIILKKHHCAIGIATIEEINRLGINPSTFLAMERALNALKVKPTLALIDGNYKTTLPIKVINIIKGDQKSISIGGASIIAKVYRDNLMQQLSKQYPDYLWEENVGYGTQKHIANVQKYGPSLQHRINFEPIKTILSKMTTSPQ